METSNKQTAVEWLIEKTTESGHLWITDKPYSMDELSLIIEKAKEIEKKQIIDAWIATDNELQRMAGEQYYNETYGSEGSDAKDVVLGYKTSLDAQMLDRIEPKQETLEEAAEKYANELPEPYNYGINLDKKKGFIEGAKWQTKQNNTSKINRVEVIQHSPPYNGRAYTNYNAKNVEIQFQDDNTTLKIFLK